jgi:hypothetical protein
MWIVSVVKPMTHDDFRPGFFPRRIYYLKDVKVLVQEVRSKGGDATVVKENKK